MPRLLFAYSERISRWLRTRAEGRGHAIAFNFASLKVVLPVSFYGGYFGAGVGILMLGVFSLATGGDYRAANVAKNFVSSLNGFAATLVFATHGAVLWPQTLALAAGTIGGGLIGALCGAHHPAQCHARAGRRGRRGADYRLCAALLVRRLKREDLLDAAAPARATRAVIALFGSLSGSTTVKWFVPAISS